MESVILGKTIQKSCCWLHIVYYSFLPFVILLSAVLTTIPYLVKKLNVLTNYNMEFLFIYKVDNGKLKSISCNPKTEEKCEQ